MLLAGDDDADALVRAGGRVRAAADTADSLRDALAELESQHHAAESRLAAARDEVARCEAAAVMEQAHRRIEQCLVAYRQACADLIDALAVVTVGRSSAIQVEQFGQGIGSQITALLLDLETNRAAVIAGTAPIPVIGEPVSPSLAPQSAPAAIDEPVETVVALQFLTWRNQAGELVTAHRYAEIKLPTRLVERATAKHLVDRYSSTHTASLLAAFGRYTGVAPRSDDRRCIDLDQLVAAAANEAAAAEPTAIAEAVA